MNAKKPIDSKALKQLRLKAGLSQLQLATKLDINVNYYAQVERGDKYPSLQLVETIARILKAKSSDFLTF